MSLVGPPGEVPAIRTELEPRYIGAEATEVDTAIQALVADGVQQGVIAPELVEFAGSVLSEPGREGALILPTFNLVNRHTILASEQNPETGSIKAYAARLEEVDSRNSGHVKPEVSSYTLKREHSGAPYLYHADHPTAVRGLKIYDDVLVASTPEELDRVVSWKRHQNAIMGRLVQNSPLRGAVVVTEAAFGGIDVTNPDRAVTELAARMLTGAMLLHQHGAELVTNNEHYSDKGLINGSVLKVLEHLHHDAFYEYLGKVDGAAKMAATGGNIEAARIKTLTDMITQDTAGLLGETWDDLEALAQYRRLDISRVIGALRK